MNDTIRELIIKEFISRAAVIVSTGTPQLYATDIGNNVLRAIKNISPAELPCCVIHPGAEEMENRYGRAYNRMNMRIEGFVNPGTNNRSVVSERILGDLICAFLSPAWVHKYVETISYQQGGTDEIEVNGVVFSSAAIAITVVYWTAIGDPYTQ